MTLHPLTDCTGNQLEVTATDSCGYYALSNVAPNTWYGVKMHFQLTFCAAAYGEGDCPETIVCDSVRTNASGNAGLDFTLGLDSCDNVGCD